MTEPTTRRIAIEPLSRVEGHGKVTLLLDEAGAVREARLHIVEFRGFEAFIVGRPYWEVPVVVQRLCGICPVSHNLCAAKALDAVVGGVPPPSAVKLRRLMHSAQLLQSHALHFFHLASPDLLFGFDSDASRRNLMGLVERHPEVAKMGVMLRKFGQQVLEAVYGKRVHGTGAVPGGVNKHLSLEARDQFVSQVPQVKAWALEAVGLARRLTEVNQARHRGFGAVPSNLLGLVATDGSLDLYDGVLRGVDAEGRVLFDGVEAVDYRALIREEARPWSYMKFPYLERLGPDVGWYKVGPLARLQLCDRLPTPLAEAARLEFRAAYPGVTHAPLAYHWARMVELLHAVEDLERLFADEGLLHGDLVATGARQREGIGIIEAPRGTLIHHYEVGDDDLVTRCNLIVSTTNNNQAMNEAIRAVAQRYLSGHEVTEGLLNHVEVAVRAFDPCLSCATHAMGQMPLEVTVVDAGGAVAGVGRRGEA
ncbi:MAG: Ni/Fe hydrogenase subunit alpha [Myxococcaceae bacterium]|jgi:NAD-reducing hydrogenase large subunit|nr:Ni/Fe hydrogenase subunit alpha [Myxococcaceae bacterium]MCA3012147.1 Ni/Fe hydrogenase subunit alpha [Myxococcaceae bacterium]